MIYVDILISIKNKIYVTYSNMRFNFQNKEQTLFRMMNLIIPFVVFYLINYKEVTKCVSFYLPSDSETCYGLYDH